MKENLAGGYCEWDLLCISEDIEFGDTIILENIYDEKQIKLAVYLKRSANEEWIYVRDVFGGDMVFNAFSLDQKGKRTKEWKITRKSIRQLKLKSLPVVEKPQKAVRRCA
jgi:hypothetical protein